MHSQVFPGLQGDPSTCGRRGRYSDGEACLKLCCIYCVLCKVPNTFLRRGVKVYSILYSLVQVNSFPPQVAKDVITEFSADGVKYLELRSTPREEKNTGKELNVLIGKI